MPAHKWKELRLSKTMMARLAKYANHRRCETCHRVQYKEASDLPWTPQVGRCPGTRSPNDVGERVEQAAKDLGETGF